MSSALTRRGLLRTGLAAAAGAVVARSPRSAGAAEAALPADPPRIRLGLVTYMVGAKMDLPTLLDVCEKSGMEGVELRSTHAHGVEPSLDAEGRAKVKAAFAKTPVRLHVLGSACEYHSPDPATVKKNIAETARFTDLAADLGAWGVKVRPNGLPKDVSEEKTLQQIGEAVRECGEHARAKNVQIVVECHGGGTSHPPRMARIMEVCKHPNVGLCWNCNGGDIQNGSIREHFQTCEPWIRHIHIHTLTDAGYPWAELFELLKAMKYSYYTMIETTGKGDPVEFLKAQRAAWEKLVG